jgi:hypothetical protein
MVFFAIVAMILMVVTMLFAVAAFASRAAGYRIAR